MTFARRPGLAARSLPLVRRTAPRGVWLTFDDGPHPAHTPAVLARLAAYRATAIFFVVGRFVERWPHVLDRVRAAGHVIGNHSFDHRVPRPWEFAVAAEDVRRGSAAIAAVGARPAWFRPPLGRINPAVVLAARRARLPILNWSLDTNDWRCRSAVDAEKCGAEAAAAVRDGDVVLLHDHHEWALPVLDRLLPALAGRNLLASPTAG